ncbi:hypothetical protein ACQUZK_09295, partial [Streptococcus pyogenes]|uniref:hypothetical protein n=1 Tax=Streptococcus pyogenes TaxID=1314 RepID=UPI003DA09FAC
RTTILSCSAVEVDRELDLTAAPSVVMAHSPAPVSLRFLVVRAHPLLDLLLTCNAALVAAPLLSSAIIRATVGDPARLKDITLRSSPKHFTRCGVAAHEQE